MKNFKSCALAVMVSAVLPVAAWAADAKTVANDPAPAVAPPAAGMHRYMVVRSFPAGALAGLDAAGETQVNKVNAMSKVRWVHSYATADRTKTYCIYEGPSEKAIRDAAAANKMSVESVTEIPVVLGTLTPITSR